MEDKKKKSGSCCSCEADFKKEVTNLENEGSKPTKAQHDKKKSEVNSAFKDGKKK